MHPMDVPTRETKAFVMQYLGGSKTRILEVGCGAGDLAAALDHHRLDVTAIDTNPFDVILFTRSLHHIHDLNAAITHAHRLLKPHGWLLVEDFAFNQADNRTMAWFYQV